MSKLRKEYIECRLFILGDEKVGKKSFVQRLLNLPCTGVIHDQESETEYNNLLSKYKEEVELDKQLQKEQEDFIKSMNSEEKSRGGNEVTSKFTSTNTLFKIDEERTIRRNTSNITKNERTNRNITANTKNLQGTSNISATMGVRPGNYKQKILREPVPEYPAKLYCVNLDRIVLKIFCIPKAEKRPPDFIPRDEDEEYELEKEHNISFDGIKNDLNMKLSLKDTCISQDRLNEYNISVFTLFIYLYDMSDFYSFESLILYYSKITKLFKFNEEENFKSCIIGNKKDKKIALETDQNAVFNEFLKNTGLKKFEMSTKPYFTFDKFFLDFFYQMFTLFQQNETEPNHKLLENIEFIEGFNKLIKSHPNFARSKRADLGKVEKVPGPEYNLNLFSFDSIEEIKQVFSDKKSRFTKKIFANKRGPVFHEDNTGKNIIAKKKDQNLFNMEIKGGLYNKPIKGYTFGILNGKLNLLQKRRDLRSERNADLYNNMDRYNNSPIHKIPLKLSKDEEYFENALKKKILYKQNIIEERQLKMNKILSIHNENIRKSEEEKRIKNQKILLQKSASLPNLLLNSASSLDEMSKEKNEKSLIKQRYHDSIFGKNQINLDKYKKQLSKIRLMSSMQMEPEPYYIDIRGNLVSPSKGVTMHEESNISRKNYDAIKYPKYRLIKDDFDKIVESGEKKMNNMQSVKSIKMKKEEMNRKQKREERLNEKEEQNMKNLEAKEVKRNKWIANKEENNLLRRKQMQDLSLEKYLKHKKLLEDEEDKQKIISDLRRDISIQKGYGDPYEINPINYSLIEESSPKYSIKGRYIEHRSRADDMENLVLGTNIELLNQIKTAQKNQSLPNFNIIKPRLPSIVFNRAERFPKPKPSTDDSMSIPLFIDGIFKPSDHKDFISKEPMGGLSQRGNVGSSYKKGPSPGDYMMKSSFDEVAKKGAEINKVRTKLRMQKALSNEKDKEKIKNQKILDKNISLELNET